MVLWGKSSTETDSCLPLGTAPSTMLIRKLLEGSHLFLGVRTTNLSLPNDLRSCLHLLHILRSDGGPWCPWNSAKGLCKPSQLRDSRGQGGKATAGITPRLGPSWHCLVCDGIKDSSFYVLLWDFQVHEKVILNWQGVGITWWEWVFSIWSLGVQKHWIHNSDFPSFQLISRFWASVPSQVKQVMKWHRMCSSHGTGPDTANIIIFSSSHFALSEHLDCLKMWGVIKGAKKVKGPKVTQLCGYPLL